MAQCIGIFRRIAASARTRGFTFGDRAAALDTILLLVVAFGDVDWQQHSIGLAFVLCGEFR